MILIVTHRKDFTADYIINKLNQSKRAYLRFNCESLLENSKPTINFFDTATANIKGINRFHSVWFRRTMLPSIDSLTKTEQEYALQELDTFLSYLWPSIRAKKWLSKPASIYNAENKVIQLITAKSVGFVIPETIISGDPLEIKEFYKEYNGDIIVKPLFYNRIIEEGKQRLIFTNWVKEDDLIDLEKRLPLPSIYQRNISKHLELRVTVVGNKVFSASVLSQDCDETKYDWRKKKLKFHEYRLNDKIGEKCISLTKELDLNFGAIDLILTPDGEIYFLEINPNGQWVWIEKDTGLKISDAIIEFLS